MAFGISKKASNSRMLMSLGLLSAKENS